MADLKEKKGGGFPAIWIVEFKNAPSKTEIKAKKAKVEKILKAHILGLVKKNKATPGFKVKMTWQRDGGNKKKYFVLISIYKPGNGGGGGVVTPTPPSPPQPKI